MKLTDREFDRAVQQALARIPAEFRPYLENVVIEVRPVATRAMLREAEIDDDVPAEEVLGLYMGTPLEDQGLDAGPPRLPDRILIFRDSLMDMCETREELIDEIRITVLHEIGHHFGLDEDRLDELGFG